MYLYVRQFWLANDKECRPGTDLTFGWREIEIIMLQTGKQMAAVIERLTHTQTHTDRHGTDRRRKRD